MFDSSQTIDELWRSYKDEPTAEKRNRLVVNYIPLVKRIASQIGDRLPSSIDKQDLSEDGIFGLLESIDRFDPTMGVEFETFSSRRIGGSMIDARRNSDHLPRSVRLKAQRINLCESRLRCDLQRDPTGHEVMESLEFTPEQFFDYLKSARTPDVLSSSGVHFDDSSRPGDRLIERYEDPHTPDPLTVAHQESVRDFLFGYLTEREKLIITLYYYECMNMEQIGEILGLVESRIYQIHTSLMSRLRRQLGNTPKDLLF